MGAVYTKEGDHYLAYHHVGDGYFKKLGHMSFSNNAISVTVEMTTYDDTVHHNLPNDKNLDDSPSNSPSVSDDKDPPNPNNEIDDEEGPPVTNPQPGHTRSFAKQYEDRFVK